MVPGIRNKKVTCIYREKLKRYRVKSHLAQPTNIPDEIVIRDPDAYLIRSRVELGIERLLPLVAIGDLIVSIY